MGRCFQRHTKLLHKQKSYITSGRHRDRYFNRGDHKTPQFMRNYQILGYFLLYAVVHYKIGRETEVRGQLKRSIQSRHHLQTPIEVSSSSLLSRFLLNIEILLLVPSLEISNGLVWLLLDVTPDCQYRVNGFCLGASILPKMS